MVKTKKFRVPQLASKDSDNVGAKRTSIFSKAPPKKVSMGIDNKEPCRPQPLGLGSAQSAPNCVYTLAPQRTSGQELEEDMICVLVDGRASFDSVL